MAGTAQEDEWYRTPDNPDPNINKFIQDYEDRCASAADEQPQEPVPAINDCTGTAGVGLPPVAGR